MSRFSASLALIGGSLSIGSCHLPTKDAVADGHYLVVEVAGAKKQSAIALTQGEPPFQASDIWRKLDGEVSLVVNGLEGAPVVDQNGRPIGLLSGVLEESDPDFVRVVPLTDILVRLDGLTGDIDSSRSTPENDLVAWVLGEGAGRQVLSVIWWGTSTRVAGVSAIGVEKNGVSLIGVPDMFWGWNLTNGSAVLALFSAEPIGVGRANGELPMPVMAVGSLLGSTSSVTRHCVVAHLGRMPETVELDVAMWFGNDESKHTYHIVKDPTRWVGWCMECLDSDLNQRGVTPGRELICRLAVDGELIAEWRQMATAGEAWQTQIFELVEDRLRELDPDVHKVELAITR